MQNNIACENVKKELMVEEYQALQWNTPQLQSTNRFIYVKQRGPDFTPVESGSQKVLVNPHFRSTSKVFVNPNFPGQIHSQPAIHVNPHMRNTLIPQIDHQVSGGTYESQNLTCHIPFLHGTRIHVNPNAKSVQIPTLVVSQTVHINPKFTNGTAIAKNALSTVRTIPTHEPKENVPAQTLNKVVVLSKTKLIRTAHISNIKKLKRRNSVKSKYKIIKTGLSPKRTLTIGNINHTSLSISKNKFKIDKRRKSSSCSKTQKKYIYDNKLVTTSDLIKSRIVKKNSPSKNVRNLSIINIGGIVYRKSGNSIRRASIPRAKDINKTVLNIQCTADNRTIYKIPPKTVKFDTKNKIVKKFKIIRKQCLKKTKEAKISPRKLRKCNVPCPSYQKYGICKGEANGKCFWKHDPDQIALCTRFLQGACIKEKCLLSHNVSPEKMPTCKYYLEGSCSKESCPYLHVKISPKAQVCKDFLEGFCKKAAECGERHQYLCPDYEKYGECLKQRCPYPHGKMVRTYLINKNKFAKKCSDVDIKTKKSRDNLPPNSEPKISEKGEVNEKRRYYTEKRSQSEETACGSSDLKVNHTENPNVEEINLRTFIGLQSRPRLGILPSYIPFGDS